LIAPSNLDLTGAEVELVGAMGKRIQAKEGIALKKTTSTLFLLILRLH